MILFFYLLAQSVTSSFSLHSHVLTAAGAVKLVVDKFGALIRTNVSAPPPSNGVDFSREERLVCSIYLCITGSCMHRLHTSHAMQV